MAVTFRQIGGAFQKAGINIEGAAEALRIKRLGRTNNQTVEEITEQITESGQRTKARLSEIDQKVKESADIDKAWKEARTGGNSAVDEAINVNSNATKPPKDPTPLANDGGVVYEQDGQGVGGASAKKEKFERVRQEVALPYDLPHAENLKNAQDIAGPDKSGILDMVRAHPFISAGIAGGVGVLGANLFDDDDE